MISYPQFQPSPIRIGHHSSIDRPFFHNEQSIGLNRKELSATSPRWRYSRSQRLILDDSIAARTSLGFKAEVLPPMSPTPTPKPQPAPKPKEGPSFPSTLDLAGGRPRGPLRPPPPMLAHYTEMLSGRTTLRHWAEPPRAEI